MRSLMLVLALGAAACAETPRDSAARAAAADKTRAALDRELAGRVPGPPQGCLTLFDRKDVKAFGDTIVYSSGPGGVRYVTTGSGCRGVGQDSILITRTQTGQLCRGDIATTVDRTSGFPTGSCSFTDFIPYRRP